MYESAFVSADHETSLFRRSGEIVALRFPDPLGRADTARRAIPHDFVILNSTSTSIESVDDGLREIWPIVADAYAGVWNDETPPSIASIRSATATGT